VNDVPLIAAVHGAGGELLVVRKLSREAHTRFPRSMLSHPGPVAIAATAALAWWGVL